MAVTVDSGPIEADFLLRHVPESKWRELMLARRRFLEISLSYDCRCLVQFVNDASLMYAALGFASVNDMIRDGYGLEPEEINVALEWLKLNPPDEPVALDKAIVLGKQYQEIDAKDRANQRPAHRPAKVESVDNNETDIHSSERPAGTSAAAALRRLRKDRPDIHARVLAGELSPHAGMVEAGFRKKAVRKKLTVLERAARLALKLSDLEWTTLKRVEDQRRRHLNKDTAA